MNSSLSLHRVALDLLIGARLSLASNPNTFLEASFSWLQFTIPSSIPQES
jgi:hypothetical protein